MVLHVASLDVNSALHVVRSMLSMGNVVTDILSCIQLCINQCHTIYLYQLIRSAFSGESELCVEWICG